MIERKIIGFGPYTRLISLPKTWLNLRGLDRGDIVQISETSSGELMVKTCPKKEERGQ